MGAIWVRGNIFLVLLNEVNGKSVEEKKDGKMKRRNFIGKCKSLSALPEKEQKNREKNCIRRDLMGQLIKAKVTLPLTKSNKVTGGKEK